MSKKKFGEQPPSLPPLSYLTVSLLSQRWDIPRKRVIAFIEEGYLTGLKIRNVYRISAHSVTSFEKKNRHLMGAETQPPKK